MSKSRNADCRQSTKHPEGFGGKSVGNVKHLFPRTRNCVRVLFFFQFIVCLEKITMKVAYVELRSTYYCMTWMSRRMYSRNGEGATRNE